MKDKYIKLPIIKEIEVEGYGLFKSDWKYEFKRGLNLFIGGNRLGKTTTVYIILYGIVGLPKENKNFFSDRVTRRNANPVVRLRFNIGADSIHIERNLFNSQINFFSINDNTYKRENTQRIDQIYETKIVNSAGISSLDDYKFLLDKLLFREEEGEYLLWNTEAQAKVLRLLFNYKKFDEEFRKLEEDVRKYDTDVRGQQDIQYQFRKRLNAIKDQKYAKMGDMGDFSLKKLEKKSKELKENIKALYSSHKKLLEKIEKLKKEEKQYSQVLFNMNREIEELDSEIVGIENVFFEFVYSDPKIQLADHKLKYYQICIFCNQRVPKNTTQKIVSKIENEKICPVCGSEFKPKIKEKNINEKNKDKLIGELIKKREMIEKKKIELFSNRKNLNNLNKKLEKLWSEKERLEEEIRNKILMNDDINLKISSIIGEGEEITVYGRDIKTLQDQINYYQGEIDKAKEKRKEALKNLENKNNEFNQTLKEMSDGLIKKFQKYVNGFFDDALLVIKKRSPKGSMISLNVFIPKFNGRERTLQKQVSKSEAIFLEYVFRMSLCELFKEITGNKSLLVIETSEGAFDMSNVKILAETISRFYSNDSYLLLISNLGRLDFLKILIEKAKEEISNRMLNFFEIGRLNKEQEKDKEKYDKIFKQRFSI